METIAFGRHHQISFPLEFSILIQTDHVLERKVVSGHQFIWQPCNELTKNKEEL